MPEDYYTLLDVDQRASEETILRAYRRKAAECHPDVSEEPDAKATFRRLNRAKTVLTDPDLRRRYDRLGHDRFVEQVDGGDARPRDERVAHPSPGEPATPRWAQRSPGADQPNPTSHLARLLGEGFVLPDHRGTGSARTVDLRSILRDSIDYRTPSDDSSARQTHAETRSCPRCGGHGAFVHDLDTGHGRRRRFEPCVRCEGDGTVSV